MLKIYFDWNCITHSKDNYTYLLEIVKLYGKDFIFPFSNAHIRDVLVSHKEGNEYFDSDISLLETICGKHYLQFKNGQIMPMYGNPRDVIDIYGEELEMLQDLEFITPEMYSTMKNDLRKLLPPEIFEKIQGADSNNVFTIIDSYIAQIMPDYNLDSIMSSYFLNPDIRRLVDAESRIKCMCMALDLYGFRPEKKNKHLMNIDTDASHIFYAGLCDIFVTADSKLRGKAEAIFQKYNRNTRIMHPKDFNSFIKDEYRKEYSFTNIPGIIDSYGIPIINKDKAHYKPLPNQIFGMFDVCHKLNSFWGYDGNTKAGLFRYSFQNVPYLFKTEIEHFCDIIEKIIPESEKVDFQNNYKSAILSGNREESLKAMFKYEIKELESQLIFYSDSESPIPAPMMLFIVGDAFEKYVSQQ